MFLFLATVSAAGVILGAYENDRWDIASAAISTVLFTALYWFTRFNYIVITTRSKKMKIKMLGMRKEQGA